jgi:hypothetical protein
MRLLPVLVLAGFLLAGCSNAPGEPSDGFDDEDFEPLALHADDESGILRGVVIDEAIRPLSNSTVTVLIPGAQNRTMVTRDDGIFGFDKLAPGEYFIQASKTGFGTSQASGKVWQVSPTPTRSR